MVIVTRGPIELRCVKQFREVVKMEHRVVFAVLAKECDVLTEVHVLEVIGNKTAIATLYALAKCGECFLLVDRWFHNEILDFSTRPVRAQFAKSGSICFRYRYDDFKRSTRSSPPPSRAYPFARELSSSFKTINI